MIPIVGDLHIGARGGSKQYYNYFKKFFDDFFVYCDSNDVKEIILLGDVFDVRKHVDTWCLDRFKEDFSLECVNRQLYVHVIVGNHDIHFKESLKVNTPSLVFSEWPETFNVIDKPTEVAIEGKAFLLIPWIVKENLEDVKNAIKKSKADYMCGHFEFNGFPMHKGSIAKTHQTHEGYGKFKKIFSGHYHTKSEKDNVLYTGTPYQTTWIDANDTKGFYVLLEDGTIVFHENKHTIHEYVTYPDLVDDKDKYVRGVIHDNTDKKKIEKWKESLIAFGPHEIKFSEKNETEYASATSVSKIESTEELIEAYIDETETNLDKNKLKFMMFSLYQMAMRNEQ